MYQLIKTIYSCLRPDEIVHKFSDELISVSSIFMVVNFYCT